MSQTYTPMLTTYLYASKETPQKELNSLIERLEETNIIVSLHEPADPVLGFNSKKPRVYLSIGSNWMDFPTLKSMPFHEKKRWIHFYSADEVQPSHVFYCWLSHTDPLPETRMIANSQFSSETPLVSVFTSAYRSKEKIQRPYHSLLNQTYKNWEWVIVDDSGDEDETYRNCLLPLSDPRVRRYRQDSGNGYIGATKRYAAGLCTGEILVELDHDDELTPDCLEKIVNAFKSNPDCGFVYGDCSEVFAENNHAHWYGWDCGFGYSVYYRVWVPAMNRWQNVLRQTTLNANTIQHLVGLPNHPRAWTKECYHLVGGHREELLVGDDYDLLVRTFLCTKFAAIPDLLYIQYRNDEGNNSTFIRNKQIQILVRELGKYYEDKIAKRMNDLGMPEILPYKRVWETASNDPARKTAHILYEDRSKKSIIFPIPFTEKNHSELYHTLTKAIENGFKDKEIIVVGNVPPDIVDFASKAPTGAIRWWYMEQRDSLEHYIQYAKYCASGKEKVVVMP